MRISGATGPDGVFYIVPGGVARAVEPMQGDAEMLQPIVQDLSLFPALLALEIMLARAEDVFGVPRLSYRRAP